VRAGATRGEARTSRTLAASEASVYGLARNNTYGLADIRPLEWPRKLLHQLGSVNSYVITSFGRDAATTGAMPGRRRPPWIRSRSHL